MTDETEQAIEARVEAAKAKAEAEAARESADEKIDDVKVELKEHEQQDAAFTQEFEHFRRRFGELEEWKAGVQSALTATGDVVAAVVSRVESLETAEAVEDAVEAEDEIESEAEAEADRPADVVEVETAKPEVPEPRAEKRKRKYI